MRFQRRAHDSYAPDVRDPAPPYRGEGPHALWHASEDPGIAVFEPHVAATSRRTSRSSGRSTRVTCRSTGSPRLPARDVLGGAGDLGRDANRFLGGDRPAASTPSSRRGRSACAYPPSTPTASPPRPSSPTSRPAATGSRARRSSRWRFAHSSISSNCTGRGHRAPRRAAPPHAVERRDRVDTRVQRHAPALRRALERRLDPFQLPRALDDDRRSARRTSRARDARRAMPTQRGATGASSPWSPSRADRRSRHRTCPSLDEHERASPPDDEVQLVATGPDVRAEDAVAAQAVVPTRSQLARIPQAPRRSCTPSRATTSGGSATGRARARSSSGRA